MRILIVSDLHANPSALAVLPDADAVICAGDLVDYGPDPAASIAWCRARATVAVAGNHDRALAFGDPDGVGTLMRDASAATRAAHRAMLGDADVAFLRELPLLRIATIGGTAFAATHAVADDVRHYAPLPHAAASVRDRAPAAGVIVVGHTHVQGIAKLGDAIAVNPGSVGLASRGGTVHFAVWTDGHVELREAAYDVEAAVRGLDALALPAAVRATLETALRRGRETPKVAGLARSKQGCGRPAHDR